MFTNAPDYPAPPGYINFYTRTSVPSDGNFGASPAISMASIPSVTSQLSGLDLRAAKSGDVLTPRNDAPTGSSVANTPRTDYKLGFDSKSNSATQMASNPDFAQNFPPRKTSVRRSGSVRNGAVAGSQPTTAGTSMAAPQDNDNASELQDYDPEDDLYLDYDPYDLSVPKAVICWGWLWRTEALLRFFPNSWTCSSNQL